MALDQRQVKADFPAASLSMLPTEAGVKKILLHMKRGKAPGFDSITAEVLQTEAGLKHIPQLLIKVLFSGSEPLRWQARAVATLYKGKGSMADISNYRGVWLTSVVAKCHHRWLVNLVSPVTDPLLRPT